MHRENGGVLTKLLVWLLVLGLLATVALFAYVRSQEPLALGDVTTGWNHVLKEEDPPKARDVRFDAGGQVYVATIVTNTGRFPVTLRGLGDQGDPGQQAYVPVDLLLGDGTTANPDDAATFTPTTLEPGSGVGILVVYAANPDLVCQLLPEHASLGTPTTLQDVPIRFSTYGVEQTQVLSAAEPFVTVAPASRTQCERLGTG